MTRVREWRPGDVALLPNGYLAVVDEQDRFVYGVGDYMNAKPGSISAKGATPLVVIDPEDRVQAQQLMSRLLRELGMSMSTIAATDAMQAALREFANPTPPIEEPTGVGATVTDNDGEMWVRHVRGEWSCLHSAPGKDVRTWVELVAQYSPLSEGVPAEADQ